MARGVFVTEGKLKGAEARLLSNDNGGVIRVRADIPEVGRKRFAMAHELGHWELHTNLSQIYLCSEDDIHGYRGSSIEIEANIFASELLMPTSMFRPLCKCVDPGIELITDLSEKFNTTLTSTAVRFVDDCNEDCIVVVSKDGQVRWWRKKESMPNVWIEPNQKVHQETMAWDFFNGKTGLSKMQKVPSWAWFPNRSYRQEIEVNEQSMKLGNYPLVLTLLWIVAV